MAKAAPTDRIVLKILSGIQAGAEVSLSIGEYSIGSSPDDDIQLVDISLKARHGKLRVSATKIEISGIAGHFTTSNAVVVEADETNWTELEPLEIVTAGTTRFALGPVSANWTSLNDPPVQTKAKKEIRRKPGPAEPRGPVAERLAAWSRSAGWVALVLVLGALAFHQLTGSVLGPAQTEPGTAVALRAAIAALPFANAVTIREDVDGSIYASGYVDSPVERRAVAAVAEKLAIPLRLRLNVLQSMRADIDTLIKSAKLPITATVAADGAVTLEGLVLQDEVAKQFAEKLTSTVSGISRVDSKLRTARTLLGEIEKLARKTQIDSFVVFRLDNVRLEANGVLPVDKIDGWVGFLQAYSKHFAADIALRSFVQLQAAPGAAPQPAPNPSGPAISLGPKQPGGTDIALDIDRIRRGLYDLSDLFVGVKRPSPATNPPGPVTATAQPAKGPGQADAPASGPQADTPAPVRDEATPASSQSKPANSPTRSADKTNPASPPDAPARTPKEMRDLWQLGPVASAPDRPNAPAAPANPAVSANPAAPANSAIPANSAAPSSPSAPSAQTQGPGNTTPAPTGPSADPRRAATAQGDPGQASTPRGTTTPDARPAAPDIAAPNGVTVTAADPAPRQPVGPQPRDAAQSPLSVLAKTNAAVPTTPPGIAYVPSVPGKPVSPADLSPKPAELSARTPLALQPREFEQIASIASPKALVDTPAGPSGTPQGPANAATTSSPAPSSARDAAPGPGDVRTPSRATALNPTAPGDPVSSPARPDGLTPTPGETVSAPTDTNRANVTAGPGVPTSTADTPAGEPTGPGPSDPAAASPGDTPGTASDPAPVQRDAAQTTPAARTPDDTPAADPRASQRSPSEFLTTAANRLIRRWQATERTADTGLPAPIQEALDRVADTRAAINDSAPAGERIARPKFLPIMATEVQRGPAPEDVCWKESRLTASNLPAAAFWLDILSVSEALSLKSFTLDEQRFLLEAAINTIKVRNCLKTSPGLSARIAATSLYLAEATRNPDFIRFLTRDLATSDVDVTGLNLAGNRYFQIRNGRKHHEGEALTINTRIALIGELASILRTTDGFSIVVYSSDINWKLSQN